MNWVNRIGLGLILYMIFIFLLGMQENMGELSYIIFMILGFAGTMAIVVSGYDEGDSNDD